MLDRSSKGRIVAPRVLGVVLCVVGWALLAAGGAGAQHQDILYGVSADGHVKTGATDFDTFSLVPDVRVFGNGVFTFNSGQGGLWTDDPGHTSNDSPPGMTMLPDDADLHFNIVVEPLTGRNLSYWDGDTYPISWGPVPNGETVEIEFGANLAVADGGTLPVTGFRIATEPGTGGIHTHTDFLLRPTGSATGGIYLLALEAEIDPLLAADAASPSPRFWLVFRYNESSTDHAAAIAWVEANLDVPDCQDGYDNDGDGQIDAAGDGGCVDALDESEFSLSLPCDDGVDNDDSGARDFPNDAGCTTASDPVEAAPIPGIALNGTAQGGLVEIEISGVSVSATTQAGDSAEDVVDALVAAIHANATLAAQGVSADRNGSALAVSEPATLLQLTDPGLAVAVPALGPAGIALLLGLLAWVGAGAARRAAPPRPS